jgi:hypothetical protein
MRKVLLTTTALVALGGVSAASAIEIGGSYAFEYTDTSNTGAAADAANVSGNTMGSDANVDFSNSITTDSGLTFGALVRLDSQEDSGSGAFFVEDQGLTISGDFGSVMMGQTDGFVDQMDNFMTSSNMQEIGATTTNNSLNNSTAVPDNEQAGKIGYRSPNINGFQFGFSSEDGGAGATANDDVTSYIVTYNLMDMATVGYAAAEDPDDNNAGADTDYTQYGIGADVGPFFISLAKGTEKVKAAGGGADTSKVDTTDMEIQYGLNDATNLYALIVDSEDKTGTNVGDKFEGTTIGLTYSIAPGVTFLYEYNDGDFTDSSANTTEGRVASRARLSVSF